MIMTILTLWLALGFVMFIMAVEDLSLDELTVKSEDFRRDWEFDPKWNKFARALMIIGMTVLISGIVFWAYIFRIPRTIARLLFIKKV